MLYEHCWKGNRQFTGTEGYIRWSPLFPRMVLTDGTKFVAENGGGAGAYWLMDAIASHQPKALKDERLREMQFWNLTVTEKDGGNTAILTCRADSPLVPLDPLGCPARNGQRAATPPRGRRSTENSR
jgi:hypothetical protein